MAHDPMPVTCDRPYTRLHRIGWACPHDDARATIWMPNRGDALNLAQQAWAYHRQESCDEH